MATRVFLLTGDEKAVHAITQILDELEISFEHSSDPTFTLKRLAGQRFDLLIVDCDNVQTATQVFNSARASAQNKGAIAIAIVEGKAGVPNAFRLGASLVLTKPVSLEQVRNTLRTGVGMARKDGGDSKLASPAAHPPAAPSFPASTLPPHPTSPAAFAAAAPAPAPIAIPVPVATTTPVVPAAPHAATTPIAPVSKPIPAVTISAPPASRTSESTAPTNPVPSPVAPVVIRSESAAAAPKPPAPSPSSEKTAPAPSSPITSPLTDTKAPLPKVLHHTSVEPPVSASLARTTAQGAAAAPALSKVTTISPIAPKEPEKAPLAPEKEKLFPDGDPAPLASLHETNADPEDSAASLRAQAVPAFGGLNKQPFAGIQPARRSHTGLIVGTLLVVAAGGIAAAWYLKPEFRKAVEWKYEQVQQRVAAWRGHAAPAPAVSTPAAAPVTPAAAPQAPAATASPQATSVDGQASSAGTTSSVPSNSVSASSSQSASSAPAAPSPAASTPSTSPVEKPAKPATQEAKQEVVNHSASPAATATSAAAAPAKLPASTAKHPAASDILEVPEDFADDQVVHRVHPAYPKQARGKKLQGSVILQAIVDKQGKVNSLQLVSGDPILAQAAAEAVKQWRYKPYSHNGEPSFFQTRVTVDFRLP